MDASRTVRARARAELTEEIKRAARRQLVEVGPRALSMRAVARELGMVSSAVYRYFQSKDDLLTALIIDAYDAVGSAVERAVASASDEDPVARWATACHAIRTWAREHPSEYALVYGSPVPGYRAPRDTVTAASRAPFVLFGVVRDAWEAGQISAPDGDALPGALDAQLAPVAEEAVPGLPQGLVARTFVAWTQLFGMISFELFGHFVGSVDPTDDFFGYAVERMGAFIGLAKPV